MRIQLGYGAMVLLLVALTIFLLLRIATLNTQIQELNSQVSSESTAGMRLVIQVVVLQQAIDRYLNQPMPENSQAAQVAFSRLRSELALARQQIQRPEQVQLVENLSRDMIAYSDMFQRLDGLIATQANLRLRLNSTMFDSIVALTATNSRYLRSEETERRFADPMLRSQQSLQMASFWMARMISENNESFASNASDELASVRTSTGRLARYLPDYASQTSLSSTALSILGDDLQQYANNIRSQRDLRARLLYVRGEQIKIQARAISENGLAQLATKTADLDQQSIQMRQIIGLSSGAIILLALIFSNVLPRTLLRPLNDLLDATRRLDQGDYDIAITTPDRREIGELARSFNQMVNSLRQERLAVQRQQAVLAARNAELEQTLAELRAAHKAREDLSASLRALSVPIVPILDQVIMIPLVGDVDAARADLLVEQMLRAIVEQRVRLAILDITGVPVVDTALVGWLVRASASARLLGAQCVLVGIGPEVAQALVASGADISQIVTRANLRSVVELASRGARVIR